MNTNERWPWAVYGTLRKGEPNARWTWEGRAACLTGGMVAGYRLVTAGYGHVGGFPYAVPDLDSVIHVDVIVPTEASRWGTVDHYDDVLAAFDGLEGYPLHYDRRLVTVVCGAADQPAWMYVPRHWQALVDNPPVVGNDWVLHRKLRTLRPTPSGG